MYLTILSDVTKLGAFLMFSGNGDVVGTKIGDIRIPGLGEMRRLHMTRAIVLQAMVELEVEAILGEGEYPTQISILERSIKLGSGLSPKSQKAVNVHIMNLMQDDYVVYRTPGHKRVRGKSSPWRPSCVSRMLKNNLK